MQKEKDKSMTVENGEVEEINDLARLAVRSVIGSDNMYLERLLTAQLEGKNKKYKSTPIMEIIRSNDRDSIKKELSDTLTISKSVATEALREQIRSRNIGLAKTFTPQDYMNNQAISCWVINSILQEKLNYREVREKSDKWKIINGVLAVILPIIVPAMTGILQYYITRSSCASG